MTSLWALENYNEFFFHFDPLMEEPTEHTIDNEIIETVFFFTFDLNESIKCLP